MLLLFFISFPFLINNSRTKNSIIGFVIMAYFSCVSNCSVQCRVHLLEVQCIHYVNYFINWYIENYWRDESSILQSVGRYTINSILFNFCWVSICEDYLHNNFYVIILRVNNLNGILFIKLSINLIYSFCQFYKNFIFASKFVSICNHDHLLYLRLLYIRRDLKCSDSFKFYLCIHKNHKAKFYPNCSCSNFLITSFQT